MLLSITSATTISTKNKLQHLYQVFCTTDQNINTWPSESYSNRPGSSKAFQHVVNFNRLFFITIQAKQLNTCWISTHT